MRSSGAAPARCQRDTDAFVVTGLTILATLVALYDLFVITLVLR